MTIKIAREVVAERLGKESFEETILHKALGRAPQLSPCGPWIAGGAVRRTMVGEKLESDFDFFFASKEQADKFADDLGYMGGKLLKENDKNQTFIVPSEIPEDTEGKGVYLPEMKVQLITFAFFASAEAVINSFDFTLCQFAYDGETITMGDFSLWDTARKKLVPARISFAVSSLRRRLKYTRQGYTVCGGALANILEQVVANPQIINADTQYID